MREPGKRGGLFIVLNASFALKKKGDDVCRYVLQRREQI